ncbi:MAG: metallophosphoesterase, partial [Clostridia bacterium]|nr:metallophosphoesterase [Clostridia bacterium]
MKKATFKTASTALAVLLALTLVFTAIFAISDSVAEADDTMQGISIGKHTVAHISDVHYYPFEYCYQDISNPDYKKSDFFYSQTTSTKLVNESGNILYKNIMHMIELAEEGKMPMYLISSGDLTKQGERVAHIDVANAFRYLQNRIRQIEGYEGFQVLVTVGNHDIYNWEAELYDKTTGEAFTAESVTLAQFAMIYNGLGFPSFDMELLSQIYGEDYFESSFSEYIPSPLSDELDFTYINSSFQELYEMSKGGNVDATELAEAYLSVGDGLGQLSYSATTLDEAFVIYATDTTVRFESDADFVPVQVSEVGFNILTANGTEMGDNQFFLAIADSLDINTTPATLSEIQEAFANGNPVFRDSHFEHITGG